MKIVAIVAGNNHPSNSATLAHHFMESVQEQGAEAETVYLKELHIDHFNLSHYQPNTDQGEDMNQLWQKIQESHGILIATPIWNFGIPAHLKNFIDRLGAFGLDSETRSKGQLLGKPFYFILTGGAPLPAWKGLMQKTTSFTQEGLRYFDASIIGTHFEPKCMQGRGKFGLVVDQRQESIESVKKQARAFAKIVKTYAETGKAPSKERARNWIMKTGEKMLKKVTGL